MRLDGITLKQLRALAAVAEHGSITAAAAALALTTPAVHSQIKGLEGFLNVSLLQRSADSAGSSLTPEGLAILEATVRMEVALSQAVAQMQALKRGHQGRVTLGVVSTAKYFAPRLVKTLKTLLPGVEVVLEVGNRDAILTDLERLAVDLAIMGRPPRRPLVEAAALGAHPHGIVAAPDHPLAHRRALSAADFASQTFISREAGSGTRILMTRYLDRLGDGQAFDLVEMQSNETIKQAVMAGLGIAFLSLHTVTQELRHGDLITLNAPHLPVERQWFLVHPKEVALRPAADLVQQAILDLKGSYLPDLPPEQQGGGHQSGG